MMLSTSNTQITQAVANAMVNAWAALCDAGSGAATISIYDGDIPASAATAITTQTLLGVLTMSDPAFNAASGGQAVAKTITEDAAANASGTQTFARVRDSDGTTCFDVSAGGPGSGKALELGAATIVQGVAIQLTSFTIGIPLGS